MPQNYLELERVNTEILAEDEKAEMGKVSRNLKKEGLRRNLPALPPPSTTFQDLPPPSTTFHNLPWTVRAVAEKPPANPRVPYIWLRVACRRLPENNKLCL